MVSAARWELPGSSAPASSAGNTVLDPTYHTNQQTETDVNSKLLEKLTQDTRWVISLAGLIVHSV